MAERFAGPAGRLRGRGRVRRGILIAVGVLVLLSPVFFLAAYRVAAKKALEGPGLRAEINRKPVELKIDWDEAVSTWPGFVSVKNLTIRGSDPNVQWIVILPEAEVRYALLPLLRRNFIVTSLRPKSIQFRLRQKGMPVLRSKQKGDLYIQVEVETPKSLTRKQRDLLKEFEKASNEATNPESAGFFARVREFFEGN